MTMHKKTGPSGPWLPVFGGPTPGCAIATTAPQPFELLGIGCLNGLGKEPRLGWQGLPLQGQTFRLTLRDAEPNGLAAFWVGSSDTFAPGVGTLPWDAASLGAPGCYLYASCDFSLVTFVDLHGSASVSLPVPVNTALHGIDAFSQSVSSASNNQLGFASSGAMLLRLR